MPIFKDAADYVKRVLGVGAHRVVVSQGQTDPGAMVLVDRKNDSIVPATMPGRPDPVAAAESPYADKWPVVLGPLLTPARVASAMRNAERGYMRTQINLLSEMRETVPHLHSEFQKRELAVVRMPIEVMPAKVAGKADRKKAAKIADEVRDRFFAIDNVPEGVHHLASSTYFGRSVLEQEWFRDASGMGVKHFHTVHAQRCSYTGENWELYLYDQGGNRRVPELARFPGFPIRKTWPDGFIIHEPTLLAGESLTRQGLGRVLLHCAMFWRWTIKDLMVFMELYAKPIRWGEYIKESDGEDIDALRAAVASVGGNTSTVAPVGTTIKLLQQAHARSPHLDTYAAFNAEISKVAVGGTLLADVGSSGSRALGEVMEKGFAELVIADANAIGSTLTRDFARPLVRMKFGPDAAQTLCPRIILVNEKSDDMSKRCTRVISLADRGVTFDADEARDVLTGLSKPEEGAQILMPLAVVAAGAQGSADVDPDGEADVTGSDAAAGTAGSGETKKKPKGKAEAKPKAKPSPKEPEEE